MGRSIIVDIEARREEKVSRRKQSRRESSRAFRGGFDGVDGPRDPDPSRRRPSRRVFTRTFSVSISARSVDAERVPPRADAVTNPSESRDNAPRFSDFSGSASAAPGASFASFSFGFLSSLFSSSSPTPLSVFPRDAPHASYARAASFGVSKHPRYARRFVSGVTLSNPTAIHRDPARWTPRYPETPTPRPRPHPRLAGRSTASRFGAGTNASSSSASRAAIAVGTGMERSARETRFSRRASMRTNQFAAGREGPIVGEDGDGREGGCEGREGGRGRGGGDDGGEGVDDGGGGDDEEGVDVGTRGSRAASSNPRARFEPSFSSRSSSSSLMTITSRSTARLRGVCLGSARRWRANAASASSTKRPGGARRPFSDPRAIHVS